MAGELRKTGIRMVANEELEQRVAERTRELRAANDELSKEIAERKRAEDRFRIVVDTIPAMVFTSLPDGSVDFVNQRWLQYLGLSLEDVQGWGWDSTIHPEDRARSIDHWRSAMAAGRSAENELRVRRADGVYRWILGRFVPLRDESGRIVKWYGVSTDIDDRKRAEILLHAKERDLEESQSRLEQAQRIAHVGHYEHDLETGIVIASDESYRILGLQPQDTITLTRAFELIHPDDRERVHQERNDAVRRGERFDVEFRMVRPDGDVRYIHSHGDVICDEDGRPRRTFGVWQDITARKLAEEELKKEKEILEKIFDHIPIMINFTNNDGQINLVNREWQQTLGWSLEEIRSEDIDLFAECYPDPIDRQQVIDFLAAATGEWQDFKTRTRDGTVIDTSWARVRLSDGTTIGIGEDITERKQAEEALRGSEDRLRLVIDTTPTMSWSVRPDGVVDFLNKRWMDYTGLSLEEYVKDPTGPIHPEDVPGAIEKWLVAKAAGESYDDEMRLRRADGEFRWFLIRTAPLKDEEGNVVKWYGVSIDIEDRRRAEMESRALIDAIPQQIWSGPPDGTNDYVNDRWRSETGLGLEEMRGDGWQTLLHPEDRDRVLKAWQHSVQTGAPYEQEERHRRADGTYRWYLNRGVPLRDSEGRIIRWYGTNTDIEDRKRAEEKLRKSESQLAEAQRLAHIGSWDWDLRTNVVNWSAELYHIFGLQPGTISVAGEVDRFIHPEDLDLGWDTVKRAIASKEPYDYYHRILRPDGAERIVRSRGSIMSDERGEAIKIFGATQDVTELKRAEEKLKATSEQLRALSARLQSAREEEGTRIAREIHDELGAALTSLRWDLESFDTAISKSGDQFRLNVLHERIGTMLSLTETIISAVRRISSELRPTVLDDLGLAEAIEWQAEQFQARTGIICHCDCSLENLELNREQSTAVFRILQEALTNILRHAEATSVDITIKAEGGEFVLTISDNGRGITEAEKSGSQSLGLLGMQERASLIGGTIIITGIKGKGTVIAVRVPISD